MVGTIVPVVNGQEKRGRARRSMLLCYAVGSLAGGLVSGALLGLIGAGLHRGGRFLSLVPSAEVPTLVGIAFMILGARELGLVRFPIPNSGWQVPRGWIHMCGCRPAAFIYGGVLGSGVLTRIPSSSFHAMIGWVLLTGSIRWSLFLTCAFAVGRILPLLVIGRMSTRYACDAVDCLGAVSPFHGVAFASNGLLLAAVGAFFSVSRFAVRGV